MLDMAIEDERALIDVLSYGMLLVSPVVLVALQWLHAPYGRYSSSSWGCLLPGRPAWVIQELPSLLLPLGFTFFTEAQALAMPANAILLGIFVMHYIQRAFVFPLLIRGGKPTPFIPFALAVAYCTWNGYIQARHLTAFADTTGTRHRECSFILGVAMFFAGMAVNIHSDHILRNLRQPGDTNYKIPRGGVFEYVSGANFFGEIVEWTGFAIASNSLTGWAFACFTALNIGPRALQHHRWYLQKFKENYPRNRRALIPYIL